MTSTRALLRRDTYVDSIQLMAAGRAVMEGDGVEWAAAVMATPANVSAVLAEGVTPDQVEGAGANDVLLAVRANDADLAEAALQTGIGLISRAAPTRVEGARPAPRTMEEGAAAIEDANVALVSVPGPFAALEAHKALSMGLHVLLFSDNVSVADELALKRRAADLGLLLMGPGAGTSALGGTGLGFANAVHRGPIGVVAAAGTGAQEVMSLADRWGPGVSNVIGVGGRDLHQEVGGAMTSLGARALEADERTEVLVVLSKPPSPLVARRLVAGFGAKPTVVALIGLDGTIEAGPDVHVVGSLEAAAATAVELAGAPPPAPAAGLAAAAERTAASLDAGRVAVRGLFSGGTLCFESMVLMSRHLGPVYSNVPLRPEWARPGPPSAHRCLDLGEEEFTRGRPHPMIDAEARVERILAEGQDPATAVVLLDVVLGYGSHPDPASILAPACEAARRSGAAVVVYVLGTEGDPQGYAVQRRRFQEAGCLAPPTAARAALAAAAISARRPQIAEAAA